MIRKESEDRCCLSSDEKHIKERALLAVLVLLVVALAALVLILLILLVVTLIVLLVAFVLVVFTIQHVDTSFQMIGAGSSLSGRRKTIRK